MKNFERIEKREGEPSHNVVVVDMLRHGSTEYLQNSMSPEEKAALGDKIPRDLTPKGEAEVLPTAQEIVYDIDPQNDIVVLWGSPAWRAQGSEDIVKEQLAAKGVEAYKDSEIPSMRCFDQHDVQFMNKLWPELAKQGKSPEVEYTTNPDWQVKNEKFETQPQVRKRAERVFNWIRYMAEHAQLDGKRLRIIGATHFEFMNPIAEDIFGTRVDQGEGVKKGEGMRIRFDFDKEKGEMSIAADFRGKHIDNITFDKKNRKFIINEQ